MAATALTTPATRAYAAPRQRSNATWVLEAGWALIPGASQGLGLLRDASIVIRDAEIVDVRPGRIAGQMRRVNASHCLVTPGFISCHTHVCGGSVTRGLFEGRRSYARPLELAETLDDERLDALTAWNLAELLRSGCTTQLDQALSLRQAQSYVRLARRWGVRAYPAGMIPGIGRLFPIWQRRDDQTLLDSVPATLAEIAANLAFARSVNGIEDGRIRSMIAPHACDTHTPETFGAILAAARELDSAIHLHLAQGAREAEVVSKLWSATPVAWLSKLGVLDAKVFGAHMTGLDLVTDPQLLRAKNVTYSTCPSAGGANGFTQPWPELLAAGVDTNIGIDTHSNDYIENLKLAVIKGEARWSLLRNSSPVPLQRPTIWHALAAATVQPANALGRKDLGRIVAGARADLSCIDISGPLVGVGALPPEPLYHLLYANGTAVRHVMTDGQWQVFDGEMVVQGYAELRQRAVAAVTDLWQLLRSDGFFDS
jgi:cytosine/adenosine deaminase-related metal-dependent hydrolase